ncbi:protein FRA10AC1 [Pararge aegeria]|uniref:Jg16308 protein n=3 Tax=Pararge aegeria TaxID=116150 RepID=A0A8S4RX40_9NEOP|nr:protein FRA10AC1 [Pararge aegeria]CAH2241741.1 jg16308 [Pararge aegeria aegeria]
MSARLRNLNPYELHKYLVNVYCLNAKGSTVLLKRDTSGDRTDLDVIRENHKFLWEEDEVADTWEKQLAKKYYDKLFKEYCICDLSRYKENKVALRWRVEQEVVLGKGQFQCGAKRCTSDQGLKSWEVNFAYVEDNEKKNALVKLRLCPECSEKLNYKSRKREVKRLKKSQKKKKRKGTDTDRELSESDHSETEASTVVPETEAKDPSTSNPASDSTVENESLWKKGVQEVEEKSREEEFADYLEDLLL